MDKISLHIKSASMKAMGFSLAMLLLFFASIKPLWAPVNKGWCRSQAAAAVAANLSFGDFATTDFGIVDVSSSGVRGSSGSIVLMGGTVSAAVFNLTGCANHVYSIVLPPTTPITAGTATMNITSWQSTPNGSGALDAAGAGTLSLGAFLNVNTGQVSGAYTGTFTVELVFQ